MNTFNEDIIECGIPCRHLIEVCPDAILIHHNNRVVFVNQECLRLFGALQREQMLGLSPLDLVSPADQTFLAAQTEQINRQRRPTPSAKIAARQFDGTLVPLESLAIPLSLRDGSTAVLHVLQNALDRQRTLEDHVRNEVQVRNMIDTAMDGIISMNEEQKILLFNSAAEKIFEIRAEDIIGHRIEELIPSRFRQQHQHDVEQFGRGVTQHRRMGTQRTVMALRATGEEFPIEASISQTNVGGKKVYTAIVRDVTEAVRYRQQIEQQAKILDQISDAVSVVDRNGQITFWNQAASRLYGWTAEEVREQNAIDVLFRGDSDVLDEMLNAPSLRRSWVGELTKFSRSGKSFIVEHRRSLLQDDTGAPTGHLCLDIDITEKRKYERAAHRSQRLESIGTLAGGIAHDLNNVLTPILMGANLLASGRAIANREGLLATMVASAQRGADLIKQLLSFAGGARGERSPIQIDHIVEETRQLLEHTLPKSIQIVVRSGPNLPSVPGNATELSQILMNLCINARDAMPEGGTLTIESTYILLNDHANQLHPDALPGPYVVLVVSDTGTGMSHEVLDRIFDPFYTTKEIGKGTGLGLATAQGIAKSHGGFITVYSEPGRGSKFSVYLPDQAKVESTENVINSGCAEQGAGQMVLLVDDEVFILQMTAAALEAAGYCVLTARDGAAATTAFSQHRDEVSIVLLDMMMPGMDGLQTLDELRRIDPDVIVVACSGLQTSQRESEVLERGAKAFLLKPYSEEDLLNTLSRAMKSSSRKADLWDS